MNNSHNFLIILFFTFLPIFLFHDSYTFNAQSSKSQTKKGSSKYLMNDFDASVTRLPPKYAGHNLKDIFNKLKARQEKLKEKNEFEKTKDFEKRISEDSTKPLIGSIHVGSLLAFVINDCPSTYDADVESLKIICPFAFCHDKELEPNYTAILWNWNYKNTDSYVGKNAFGAEVEVSREESNYYNLKQSDKGVFFNIDYMYIKDKYDMSLRYVGYMAKIHLSPDVAKKVKSNIKSLLVCKLEPPYYSNNLDIKRATFDSPSDETNRYNYLNVRIIELWFFDYSNGKILYKEKTLKN